jgi:predicted ATPase with chaperone activity
VPSSTYEVSESLLKTFLDDERFWPAEPTSLADSGLSQTLVESLVCTHLAVTGAASGRAIADRLCLPFRILEDVYSSLRTRQVVVHSGAAPFNDYYYMLTEQGHERARRFQQASAYVGPAPVPFADYVNSVEAQCISSEAPTDEDLASACRDITVDPKWFDLIGPAINSGAGMFLFGSPGNGKSTLATRITACFGQELWIPRVIVEDDQLVKLFDSSYHQEVTTGENDSLSLANYDRRWVKITRPTVMVGGELTLDSLEIQSNGISGMSEAPLQMKSNGGCLLIDDFGRQRINAADLLNRWIIPLERGHDFLTLPTGKKIQVPFEQLIIFSTNLQPSDLVDEAFLRRIPYKIEIADPDEEECFRLFELYAAQFGCRYEPDSVRYLIDTHYRAAGRPMRRCHARDLLRQVRNYCRYRRLPFEMRRAYLDRAVTTYFAVLYGDPVGRV